MKKITLNILFFTIAIFACGSGSGPGNLPVVDTNNTEKATPEDEGKETYFPLKAWRVNENNDFKDANSQFNIHRMIETPNLTAFWEAPFGSDPSKCADEKYRFDIHDIMAEGDKMFNFFRDELKFAKKGNSISDKYRFILFFYYSDEGTVYGGGVDDKVGAMWITPNRVKRGPYGAIAHEMGHSFQHLVRADGYFGYSERPAGSRGQAIGELTSQYMLWQYYPNWIVFENYHLVAFMNNTHKTFLHEDIQYNAPFVLEYWAGKHGKDIVARLWYESVKGEDPALTYMRITNTDQVKFNAELFDAYRRFITWDMDRIRDVSSPYINQHTTKLNPVDGGWYRIDHSKCPQNYGYNGIKLNVPAAGTEVKVDFKGIAGAEGYTAVNIDKAGWHYGFMAYKNNGERVYSDVYIDAEGIAKFTVPENTANLWLVVMGAPKEHWIHLWVEDKNSYEQWPYEIKITGTTIAE